MLSEGMAGQVFQRRCVVSNSALKPVTSTSSTAKKKKYAKSTFVSEQWLEKQLVKAGYEVPQSFWGTLIEVDGGKIWGVLLIDSRAEHLPDGLRDTFFPFGTCISKLLSRKHE